MRPYILLLAIGAATVAAESRAQDALEEIVVTARYRETGLMESPASITVVGAESIAARSARHLESVLNLSPNVNFSSGASRARFVQIRGVGDLEQFVDPKHFPSVGISIDSINLGGTANAAMLLDVDQVEILRGPQGTNFGTSALAGLINLRGRRPADELEGSFELGIGNYGSSVLGGAIGGRISETVSARAAVQKHEGDGYIDNTHLGRDDTNGFDETAARVVFEITPSDETSYAFTALYYDGDNGYDAFSLSNTRETLSDQPGRDAQRTAALSGNASWSLSSELDFELIATWLDSELDYGFDEDWTFVGYCDGTFCDPVLDFFSNTDRYLRDRDEVSVDARLNGRFAFGDRRNADYVVGLYGQQRDERLHREYYGDFFSDYDTDRLAAYGELGLPLGARLQLTAGLRIESFDDNYDDSFGFASGSDDTLSNTELTLSYLIGDNAMIYGTLARGEKAGGVNTEASANLPFMQPLFQDFIRPRLDVRTETLENREIGFKGSYSDGRLDVRAALFRMDRRDAQLESWMWDSVNWLWIGFLDNADGSNTGAELEVDYRFSEGMRFFGALGLLDTEVDEITVFDLDANEFRTRTGIDQAKSASWQYHLGMRMDLSQRLSAQVEFEGRDEARFGYYHDSSIDDYHVLNASFVFDLGNTELRVWGRNLTDEDYAVHGLYFGNDPRKAWVNETYYQYAEPRLFGVTLSYGLR